MGRIWYIASRMSIVQVCNGKGWDGVMFLWVYVVPWTMRVDEWGVAMACSGRISSWERAGVMATGDDVICSGLLPSVTPSPLSETYDLESGKGDK